MNRFNCFILCLLFIPSLLVGQSERQVKIGFGLDAISYIGDLSDPDQAIHRIYPGANLSIQLEGPKRLKIQLNGGFGKFSEQYDGVKPSTSPGVIVNTFVETSFYYGDLRLKYRFPISQHFHPFLTAGAGVLAFTPRDQEGRFLNDALFTREPDENYSTIVPQIPVGAGIQARINPAVSVSLEYLFRYTPTDYLDNIGRLGTRPGHDFLHGLQLSMYITLSTPPPPPTQQGPYYNAQNDQPDGKELTDSAEVQVAAMEQAVDDMLVGEEPTRDSSQSETESSAQPNALNESQAALNTDNPSVEEEIDWAAKEAEAIAAEKFIYYKIKKKDDLNSIAQQYHVSVDGLMQVNYLTSQTIFKGQVIRIPKVE
ncbi:MAG: LysM peptidoglycan-binding domain-containing protein [Bacteroidia bacterium]